MGQVYVVRSSGETEELPSYSCATEDKELQELLLKNDGLLVGEQIDPEDPCRWLLIKREMPVPNPATGSNQWSLDFFFVDQNATPTFVECKRHKDTRSRREVVAQMLDYAANGQRYWSSAYLRQHAEGTAKQQGKNLADSFHKLQTNLTGSLEEFFLEVERRLRSNEMRLIFFLEQAPTELKRLVEFLNAEMKTVDVLLVEARHFNKGDLKIVVPTLFGFTEQIREVKRVNASTRQPVAFDWASFRANAEKKRVSEAVITAMKSLYDTAESLHGDIAWGRGTVTGSFSPQWPAVCSNAAPFSVYADGKLEMHFSSFRGSPLARSFASKLLELMKQAGFTMPPDADERWLQLMPDQWVPLLPKFDSSLRCALESCEFGIRDGIADAVSA